MARIGVTYEEVSDVADQILQQQKNPTIERVRAALGGTGSFGTLSKHLQTWRNQRLLSGVQKNPKKVLPSDAVSRAVDQVWQQLNEQTQAEIKSIQQQSAETIEQLTAEKLNLVEKNTQLAQTLEKLKIENNHLVSDLTLIQKTLIEQQKVCAVLEETVNSKEILLQQYQLENEAKFSELKNHYGLHIKDLKEQFEQTQKQHQQAFSDLKEQTEKQRQTLIVEIDQLRVAKQKTETAHLKAATELIQQQKLNSELKEQVKELKTDMKILNQEKQTLNRNYEEVEKQVAILGSEINLKNTLFKEFKEQLNILTQEIIAKLPEPK